MAAMARQRGEVVDETIKRTALAGSR
jgi:hypothetical protein